VYDAVADDYCYPGTTVLKNKLNLTDVDELAAFEAEVSVARAD
jgi:cell filamentation protein